MYDKSFYQVFECSDPNDYWSYDKSKVLFESDNVAHAHGYAWKCYNENDKSKYFVVIQPYDGACRGGYGFTVEQNKKDEPEMNIQTIRDNLQKTIAGKEKYLAECQENYRLSSMGEGMALRAIIEFLEINIDELKRILQDVEACCETHVLLCSAV